MPIDPTGWSDDLLRRSFPEMRADLKAVVSEMNRRFGTQARKYYPVGEDDVVEAVQRLGPLTATQVRAAIPGATYRDVQRQLNNAMNHNRVKKAGSAYVATSPDDA